MKKVKNNFLKGWNVTADILPTLNLPAMENDHAIVLGYNDELGIFKAKLGRDGMWAEIASGYSNSTEKATPTYWTELPHVPEHFSNVQESTLKSARDATDLSHNLLNNDMKSVEFIRHIADDLERCYDVASKYVEDNKDISTTAIKRIALKQRIVRSICEHIQTLLPVTRLMSHDT